MKKLIIEDREINGICPVYKIGDRIVLDDEYKVNLTQTSAICMHSIASIVLYYIAFSNGIHLNKLGLLEKMVRVIVHLYNVWTHANTLMAEL